MSESKRECVVRFACLCVDVCWCLGMFVIYRLASIPVKCMCMCVSVCVRERERESMQVTNIKLF